ncbi:unnamed protein product [Cuscuta epithymum]|uniref:Uncharacterized protein n=1 Tax=Cuscuta epithymum TaxID=186058 RepID=A0AAV0D8H4_9ASTE|nr:unnamed protein product [Cuscuta epithymum]
MGAGESRPDIYSANRAVEEALKRVDLNSTKGYGQRKDKKMELAMELTWMKSYLINSRRTDHGRKLANVWCPAIELLAGSCDESLLDNTQHLDAVIKKFASLRPKIQPFIVPTCECDHPPPSEPFKVSNCHCDCDHPPCSRRP